MLNNNDIRDELITLINEKQNDFYRLAFRYMKNEHDSIEVVQEAVVKSLEKIYSLKQKQYLKTWFYRILINECLTRLRKNKKIVLMTGLENQLTYVDNKFTNKNNNIAIFNAIDKLDEKYKSVIVLRFYEELKLDQIAFVLNINVNTVKSRLYRGLQILKIDLKDDVILNLNEK